MGRAYVELVQPSVPISIPISRAHRPAVTGLDEHEASERLARLGRNQILHEVSRSPWAHLASQFRGAMIWLLIAATVLSAVLGEVADAIAIGSIVILNGLFGFFQEYRSERALAAMRSMTAPRARVLRGGRTVTVPAADVVPGDVLVLEAGDVVAADACVIEAHTLATVEAALTGESQPSSKTATPSAPSAPLAERHDAVFMGTWQTAPASPR